LRYIVRELLPVSGNNHVESPLGPVLVTVRLMRRGELLLSPACSNPWVLNHLEISPSSTSVGRFSHFNASNAAVPIKTRRCD